MPKRHTHAPQKNPQRKAEQAPRDRPPRAHAHPPGPGSPGHKPRAGSGSKRKRPGPQAKRDVPSRNPRGRGHLEVEEAKFRSSRRGPCWPAGAEGRLSASPRQEIRPEAAARPAEHSRNSRGPRLHSTSTSTSTLRPAGRAAGPPSPPHTRTELSSGSVLEKASRANPFPRKKPDQRPACRRPIH